MDRVTTIYCGQEDGKFHRLVEERINSGMHRAQDETWFFPEIDYGCRGGPIARHPARIIELVPDMIGRTIITMSEHIILAFQQLVRDDKLGFEDLHLYCGDMRIYLHVDGDLACWPKGFFQERLELL